MKQSAEHAYSYVLMSGKASKVLWLNGSIDAVSLVLYCNSVIMQWRKYWQTGLSPMD